MQKIILIFITITLTSCAIHSGLTTNENVHNTTVELSQANYKVISFVSGSSTVEYFLGIGGMDKPAQIQSARLKMLKNAELVGGPRALINETVEIKRSTFLLWTEVEVTVSAYVIEFGLVNANKSNVKSDSLTNSNDTLIKSNSGIKNISPDVIIEKPYIKKFDEISDTVNSSVKNQITNQIESENEITQNLIKLESKLSMYKVPSNKFTNGFYPEENDYVLVSRFGFNDIICKIRVIECYSKFCRCNVWYYDFETKALMSLDISLDDIKYAVYLFK